MAQVGHGHEGLMNRREVWMGLGVLGAVGVGSLVVTNRPDNVSVRSGDKGPKQPNNQAVHEVVDPTEAVEPTLVADEPLVESGEVAMTNPTLHHIEGVYDEGETTPEMYREAYDENDPWQEKIVRMHQLPDTLLEGPEGTHGEYIDEVARLIGDAAKPGRTKEQLMKFMRPEFFADRAGMNPDEIADLEAEKESAIDTYVETMVADFTGAIDAGFYRAGGTADRVGEPAHKMLAQILRVALRKFAYHALKHGNDGWDLDVAVANSREDMRGDSVGVFAELEITEKRWNSDGEMIVGDTATADIFFRGTSNGRGMIDTTFSDDYSDEYKSFMDALDKIERS